MRICFSVRQLSLLLTASPLSADIGIERTTDWHGFERQHFTVVGKQAWLVIPETAIANKPWIWRARFPGYHDEMDVRLVKQGFHLAYIDVGGLFGNFQAMQIGDKLYDHLTQQQGLSKTPVLEGVSRGGLFVYHWLMRHPERVACVYCDTPVLDFKSWPGGQGTGRGSTPDWERCLTMWKLTPEQAQAFVGSPVNAAAPVVARHQIPVLHIVSENDIVVPPKENTYLLRDALNKLGHEMELISVAMGTESSHGHHFKHPDPQRVVDFIRRHGSSAGP